MEQNLLAVLLGGAGAVLKVALDEWQARNRHKRDMDFAEIEARTAPMTTGSSGMSVETSLDKAIGEQSKIMPRWITALRGSMRSWLAVVTFGLFTFATAFTLAKGGEIEWLQPIAVDLIGNLDFLTILVFTFFFGTRTARK